jgi:hypothetical protein
VIIDGANVHGTVTGLTPHHSALSEARTSSRSFREFELGGQ